LRGVLLRRELGGEVQGLAGADFHHHALRAKAFLAQHDAVRPGVGAQLGGGFLPGVAAVDQDGGAFGIGVEGKKRRLGR
jgi:hypothetical protein